MTPRPASTALLLPAADGGNLPAVMFPLSAPERRVLTEELGAGWVIAGGRRIDAPGAVLIPPCRPQTTEAVGALFPAARLVVLDSSQGGPDSLGSGPVHRTIEAGADVYTLHPRSLAA